MTLLPPSPTSMPSASDSTADRLLDVDEAAVLLNVTKRWVGDAVRDGRLPHLKLGRFTRFRRSSLLAWIEEQERRW